MPDDVPPGRRPSAPNDHRRRGPRIPRSPADLGPQGQSGETGGWVVGCFGHAERVSGRLLATTPPEIVVRDEEDACVYLPGRRARQPLRQPLRRLTAA